MKKNTAAYLSFISTILCCAFSSDAYAQATSFRSFIGAVRGGIYSEVLNTYHPSFLNRKTPSGRTALSYAVENNHYNVTRLLLRKGADPSIKDNKGEPVYCRASNPNMKDLFKGYNFESCQEVALLSGNKLLAAGAVAAVGGLAGGGGGGGGGSGGSGGSGRGSAIIMLEEYNNVGEVSTPVLSSILNSESYKKNINNLGSMRTVYAHARGFKGTVDTTPETPAFMDSVNTAAPVSVSGDIRVAVLDSGVNYSSQGLSGNLVTGLTDMNLVKKSCDDNPYCMEVYADNANPKEIYLPTDRNKHWHGTAVANIIAGNGSGSSILGIAPNADIIPYRVVWDDGHFIVDEYMGQAFKNAADAGATVINNSWGNETKPTDNASIFNSKQSVEEHFGDTDYQTSHNSNYINQMLYAVDPARDAIFVFAAGNAGLAQPSSNNAIPLFYDEFQTSTGEYKNFITAVAFDSRTNALASYSNQCGVAQRYCLAAPGSYWQTEIYSSGDLTSMENKDVNGTSFAAAAVSGAVAVLKGAFPYLSGEEITALLFITARDLGETGVDEVYGWGLLDLERATRPVGVPTVPVANMKGARGYAMSSSVLKLNPVIYDSIGKQDLSFLFIDEFNRSFNASLNEKVEIIQNKPDNIDILNRFANSNNKSTFLGENNEIHFYHNNKTPDQNRGDMSEFKMSYNADNTTEEDYSFSFYYGSNPYTSFINNEADFYKNYALSNSSNSNILNPYFRNDSKENFGFNSKLFLKDNISVNFGMVYQNYSVKTESYATRDYIRNKDIGSSVSFISSVEYAHNDNITTGIEVGIMNEKETLFSSQTSGAFGLGENNKTYFMSLKNDINYNTKLSFFSRLTMGQTRVSAARNSLIEDVSTIYSNSFASGVNYIISNEETKRSNLSFVVSQSLNISSGRMRLNLPSYQDPDGTIHYQRHNINLRSSPNLDYQLAYGYEKEGLGEFNFGIIISNYNNGFKTQTENLFLLKYQKDL